MTTLFTFCRIWQPHHFANDTQEWMHHVFPNWSIARCNVHAWLHYSPKSTSCDFFLLGWANKIRTKYKILSHILNIIPANTLQAAAAATNIFDSFRKYKSGIMCKN
jgi:hypothetical protein